MNSLGRLKVGCVSVVACVVITGFGLMYRDVYDRDQKQLTAIRKISRLFDSWTINSPESKFEDTRDLAEIGAILNSLSIEMPRSPKVLLRRFPSTTIMESFGEPTAKWERYIGRPDLHLKWKVANQDLTAFTDEHGAIVQLQRQIRGVVSIRGESSCIEETVGLSPREYSLRALR